MFTKCGILGKPRITKSLVDMTVDEGQTLKLEVEVEGCPEPKVKWYKDGKEVNTDARIKIERDTKRSFLSRSPNFCLTSNPSCSWLPGSSYFKTFSVNKDLFDNLKYLTKKINLNVFSFIIESLKLVLTRNSL